MFCRSEMESREHMFFKCGSLDNNYNPVAGKLSSPYSEEMEDDLLKKKNGNMLKKIGVLWKKPQK